METVVVRNWNWNQTKQKKDPQEKCSPAECVFARSRGNGAVPPESNNPAGLNQKWLCCFISECRKKKDPAATEVDYKQPLMCD